MLPHVTRHIERWVLHQERNLTRAYKKLIYSLCFKFSFMAKPQLFQFLVGSTSSISNLVNKPAKLGRKWQKQSNSNKQSYWWYLIATNPALYLYVKSLAMYLILYTQITSDLGGYKASSIIDTNIPLSSVSNYVLFDFRVVSATIQLQNMIV